MSLRSKLFLPPLLLLLLIWLFPQRFWMPRQYRHHLADFERYQQQLLYVVVMLKMLDHRGRTQSLGPVLQVVLEHHPHWQTIWLRPLQGAEGPVQAGQGSCLPEDAVLELRQELELAGVVNERMLRLDMGDALGHTRGYLGYAKLIILSILTVIVLVFVPLTEWLVRGRTLKLNAAITQLVTSNDDASPPSGGGDEMGQLVSGFEGMRCAIQEGQQRYGE